MIKNLNKYNKISQIKNYKDKFNKKTCEQQINKKLHKD